jgi:hypothetical protein
MGGAGGLDLSLRLRAVHDDVAQEKTKKVGTAFQRFRRKKKENLKGVLAAHDGRATPWQSLPASSLLQRDPPVYADRPWSAAKRREGCRSDAVVSR